MSLAGESQLMRTPTQAVQRCVRRGDRANARSLAERETAPGLRIRGSESKSEWIPSLAKRGRVRVGATSQRQRTTAPAHDDRRYCTESSTVAAHAAIRPLLLMRRGLTRRRHE